ncbi:MAG: hypothetical protein PHI88_00290 [Candidatus Pacebacteria bacterium]|nr:hypothetical protein [Candidatus Paceibacterota bacterium]
MKLSIGPLSVWVYKKISAGGRSVVTAELEKDDGTVVIVSPDLSGQKANIRELCIIPNFPSFEVAFEDGNVLRIFIQDDEIMVVDLRREVTRIPFYKKET